MTTTKLGLVKPLDGNTSWGDDYRNAMDAIDAWAVKNETRGIAFYIGGEIEVAMVASFKAPMALKALLANIEVDVAPVDADLIVDVKKNGTTIFTTTANRPTVTAGNTSAVSNAPDVQAIAQHDKITIEIIQVGSTTAGSNLSLTLVCEVESS